jgi:hypothetical protein
MLKAGSQHQTVSFCSAAGASAWGAVVETGVSAFPAQAESARSKATNDAKILRVRFMIFLLVFYNTRQAQSKFERRKARRLCEASFRKPSRRLGLSAYSPCERDDLEVLSISGAARLGSEAGYDQKTPNLCARQHNDAKVLLCSSFLPYQKWKEV